MLGLKIMRGIVASIASLALFFGTPLSGIYAQMGAPSGENRTGLQITPAILDTVINRGQSRDTIITIINITNDYLPIHVDPRQLEPQEEQLTDKERFRFDASQWISVHEPDFILEPGEKRPVKVSIAVPADAEPGGHYATILFQPLISLEDTPESVAQNLPNVGALAFIVVPGEIKEELDLVEGSGIPLFNQSGQTPIRLHLANWGNVHSLPTTNIKIVNWRGKLATEIKLPTRFVLPNTLRKFEIIWDNSPKLGWYWARSEIRYGTPAQTITPKPEFFVILPWKPLAWLLPVGISVFTIIKRTRGRWRQAWATLRNED